MFILGQIRASVLQQDWVYTRFKNPSGFIPLFTSGTLGNFNILTVSFFPSFLSSLSAIVIERPSRRTLLCLYVSNIATETLFRMGVWRGYFSTLPRGEVYIFAASITILLYMFRGQVSKQDSIFKIIRFVIGKYEEPGNEDRSDKVLSDVTEPVAGTSRDSYVKENERSSIRKSKNPIFNAVWESFKVYKEIIDRLKSFRSHSSCPHPYSCAHYILTGTVKLFGCGLGAQMALKLVLKVKQLLRRPKLIKSLILRKDNLYLASFLGGFAGLYRLASCSLRRAFNEDSRYYAIPAGLLASVAFSMYPDNTVALYVMWKALQLLWNSGVENGKLPEVKWFVILLYCFSTAVLFHAAIIEPQNLRSSYWKFLCNLSGGRIAAMARTPLDGFGLGTSAALQEVLRKTRTTDQHKYSF
ncbi:transmembrane protein 135 isoform X2 [Cephus cinctus]|uniref:Transmembrane protein 135 isoform X2 n=1 Tax=Cephus cinctus TaxID=211228 RepID=A0AAJ7VYQ4_CEPCN|nr:transmembrane protein 135 isoform X2 [Cephus cinctus]